MKYFLLILFFYTTSPSVSLSHQPKEEQILLKLEQLIFLYNKNISEIDNYVSPLGWEFSGKSPEIGGNYGKLYWTWGHNAKTNRAYGYLDIYTLNGKIAYIAYQTTNMYTNFIKHEARTKGMKLFDSGVQKDGRHRSVYIDDKYGLIFIDLDEKTGFVKLHPKSFFEN